MYFPPAELASLFSYIPGNTVGEADIAAVSIPGVNSEQLSGNLAPFNPAHCQGTDHGLRNTEPFNDAPYVPPRTEPPTYAAPDPRAASVYETISQQYPYEVGNNPSNLQRSYDWSTSSPSSTSSNDYGLESNARHIQVARPPRGTSYPQHYPAYQGQHRVGLEHVRFGQHPSNTGGSYYRGAQDYLVDPLLAPDDTRLQTQYSLISHQRSSSSPTSITTHPPNVSSFSVSAPSTEDTFPDAGPYLRKQLGFAVHQEVSLRSLPDPPPGEKPSTPLPMLIKLAIYGSPKKQLTLQEIYSSLENRFQWFRDHKNDRAWKNSIRHNLSLNKVFKHVARPITEPGKGNYWQLDVSGGEGYKRERKRRSKNKAAVSEEEDEGTSEVDDDRPSPGPSRSTPVEENIDPELRGEGHVVGEGRTTRGATRRAGTGSPYPQQSPLHQQGPLPVVAGDVTVPNQLLHRFGQPSFNLATYSQTMASAPFAGGQSSSMLMAPATQAPNLSSQYMATYDQVVHGPQPVFLPGVDGAMTSGGLVTARPVMSYPESQRQSRTQGSAPRSSSESSSSGSSRTWNEVRSRSQ